MKNKIHEVVYVECADEKNHSDYYLHHPDKWIPLIKMGNVLLLSEEEFWELMDMAVRSGVAGESIETLRKDLKYYGEA